MADQSPVKPSLAERLIHPAWATKPQRILDGFSLEMTAKDIAQLQEAAPAIPTDTPLSITFLPGEDMAARVAAAVAVRRLGFEPMPHFSARRILSEDDFGTYLRRVVREAGVERCFVVAGDPPAPIGPYEDTMALIETGAFEQAGIKAIGIGGHPEGHPVMTAQQCWDVLSAKVQTIQSRGMAALIVTQFGFDADAQLAWLVELRQRGIDVPVRIGIPGPAGIRRLLGFAARCGVGVSASVLKKYGISAANLLGNAGPDRLVDEFARRLGEDHGPMRLHFYPFGGLKATLDWIRAREQRLDADPMRH